ncbi:MAG: hypothetical protein KJ963_02265, partial [Bacteroidetes bacterium]|nr:hypothetical protein [Bacteroidota bacterium]
MYNETRHITSSFTKSFYRAAYFFLTPALAAIFIFFFLPVLAAFVMSFTDFDIYSLGNIQYVRFVGFRNYLQLFNDPLFWQALQNT